MDDPIDFLLELESALHSVSVPADVTAQLVTRAAARLGARIDLAIFQSYLAADLSRGAAHEVRLKRISFESHWDIRRTQQLTDLAKALGDGRVGLAEGRDWLARIKAEPALYSKPIVVLGYGVYSAAVAARVGGNLLDAAAAALVGLVAGLIHYGAARHRSVDLQQTFLAGLCGAPLVLLLSLLIPINAPKVLFSGVVLLVPAMVLTIAVHEIANDALESGVLRLVYGLLRFLMLAFGVGAALTLWQLFAPLPALGETHALPIVPTLAMLVFGAGALVLCLQARTRDVGWMIAAVLLAYGTQELTKLVVGDPGAPFASAFVLGVAAQLYQRLSGRMAILFVVPGLLQLAPGFLGTRAMLELLAHQPTTHTANFFEVLLVALQLVTGLLVAAIVFRTRPALPELRPAPTSHS